MSRKRPKRKKKKNRASILFLLTLSATIIFGGYSLAKFDERFFPSVIEVASLNAEAKLNKELADQVQLLMTEEGVSSADFYSISSDENGKINSFSANTILVNEMCSKLASNLSEVLMSDGTYSISVPFGLMLGINSFANIGPKYDIVVRQLGGALVDYETEFRSAGINQTNYLIWLNVETRIEMINLAERIEIKISRKIALIDTVINGEVPDIINTLPGK